MPSSSVRMGSNRSQTDRVTPQQYPKKPFMPRITSQTNQKRVEGKTVQRKKSK